MAININRYVDITSSVGGSAAVSERQLIARLITSNDLLPPNTYVEFSSASEVGDFFGTSSDEYKRAQFYFGFISKLAISPDKISFWRWVDAATAPKIFGYVDAANPQAIGTYTPITAGSFKLTIGATTNEISGLDFSTAVTLADVANIIETAINLETGLMWTAATVTYSNGAFNFVGGDTTTSDAISVSAGTVGTDISTIMGWLPAATFVGGAFVDGAIWAAGAQIETITDTLTASAGLSDNFGSFAFVDALTLNQVIEAATWNDGENVKYMYNVPVTSANASAWANTVSGVGAIGGVGLSLSNVADEYPEMLPMAILAATDYARVNSVQNYEFQQSSELSPSVTDDSTADSMDTLRINYMGETQTAGQQLSFYQRGVLMGISTDPLDMNTYANEMWLKSAAQAAIMNLLLALAKVSANAQGRSQILATLQSVINQGLENGSISVGKTLTDSQIQTITALTDDPNAYQQVQSSGYWVDVVIVGSGAPVTYTATYTLIYSKDDVIRKVTGSQILI